MGRTRFQKQTKSDPSPRRNVAHGEPIPGIWGVCRFSGEPVFQALGCFLFRGVKSSMMGTDIWRETCAFILCARFLWPARGTDNEDTGEETGQEEASLDVAGLDFC